MKYGLVCSITAGIMFISLHVSAGPIYKWVDENGQIHYGEKPGNASARPVRVKPSPPSQTSQTESQQAGPPDRDRLLHSMEQDRLARQEKRNKDKKDLADRKRQCVKARDTLQQYTAAAVLYDLDEQGNRVPLSEAQRRRVIAQLEARIKTHCD